MTYFCQACGCTDCLGHCAKPTDIQAVEQQYHRDCVAVDEDANPRADGHAYCDRVWELVVPEIVDALNSSTLAKVREQQVLRKVRLCMVSGYVAGRKDLCGVQQNQLEN